MLVTKQQVLRRFSYPVIPASHLEDGPKAFTLLGERIVVWRDGEGRVSALEDRCCHRTAALSRGFYDAGQLVCGYHGWTYDQQRQVRAHSAIRRQHRCRRARAYRHIAPSAVRLRLGMPGRATRCPIPQIDEEDDPGVPTHPRSSTRYGSCAACG